MTLETENQLVQIRLLTVCLYVCVSECVSVCLSGFFIVNSE